GKTHGVRQALARILTDHPHKRITYTTYDQRAAVYHEQTVRCMLPHRRTRTALRPAATNQLLPVDPPANLVVIDDPVRDREQAHSAIDRDVTWSWWASIVNGHLAEHASVAVVMTPRHHDDLAGRLIT